MYRNNEGSADEVYRYCRENFDHTTITRDGNFVNKKGELRNRVFTVSKIGRVMQRVHIMGKPYLAHRVVWLMAWGTWPDGMVTFKDGNGCNCALRNLELMKGKNDE